MEILMAGLIGACAAAAIMVFYNSLSQKMARRTDLTMDVISWADDVYDRLITIHAQRDATFTGVPFGLSNDEYRTIVKEVKAMLLASKMRAKVALVYGNGFQLRRFDSLRDEFIGVTEMLLQASGETWTESNKQINEKFTNVIEPLMKSVETMFIAGARSLSVTRDLMRSSSPTLYLPIQNKDVVLKSAQPDSMRGIGRFVAWQSVKLAETFFAVLRIIVVLAIVGFVAWFYLGRPDIVGWCKNVASLATEQLKPESRVKLCVWSPADYGLNVEGASAPIDSSAILTVETLDTPIRLGIKNGEDANIANAVFMIFLPEEIGTINDRSWRGAWQEVAGRKGRWFVMSIKNDIKSGELAKFEPPIEARFPAEGDYRIPFKYFSDDLAPKTGWFLFKVTKPGSRR